MKTLRSRHEARTGWLFAAPFFIVFLIFNLYPEVYGIVMSFMDKNSMVKFNNKAFVGLRNYRNVLSNSTLGESVLHTIQFSVIYVVLIMTLSVFLAVVLNKEFKGRSIVRTMLYMPYVTNTIAIGIVWKFLFNPYNGPINQFLLRLGWPQDKLPMWLSGLKSALPTTAVVSVWAAITFQIIIFLAALQNISEELIEAAQIEGAGKWQIFWHITMPLIMPTFCFVLTITIINSFQTFTIISALTNGGPGTATHVLSYQIYSDAFLHFKMSYGAAEGTLMTIGLVAVTYLIRLLNRGDRT